MDYSYCEVPQLKYRLRVVLCAYDRVVLLAINPCTLPSHRFPVLRRMKMLIEISSYCEIAYRSNCE